MAVKPHLRRIGRFPRSGGRTLRLEDYLATGVPSSLPAADGASWPRMLASDTAGDSVAAAMGHLLASCGPEDAESVAAEQDDEPADECDGWDR